jgi:hypothetical protein
MQAVEISAGQTIHGFGLVRQVNIFCNRVAARKRPNQRSAVQAMGMAGSAFMAAEAERECYELVPSSVRAVNTDGEVRTFAPNEFVNVVKT